MYKLFNPENKFWAFTAKLADVACISFLWVICSLPVVTLGASTEALWDFTMKQAGNREGAVWKSFFSSFKKHFRRATFVWLLQLAVGFFLGVDDWCVWKMFCSTHSTASVALMGLCGCLSLAFLFLSFYVYPLISRYDLGFGDLLKKSAFLAVGSLHVSITLLVIVLIGCVLFYYLSGLFFFWVAYGAFFSSYFILGACLRYEKAGLLPPPEEADE